MQARVLVPLQIAGTPPPWGQTLQTLAGDTMGTTWSVAFIAPPELRHEPLRAAIAALFAEIIAQMSPWEPDSLISRINRAEADSRWTLPPGFTAVMDAACKIAAASDGAFDPSSGALVRHWGFGPPGAVEPTRPDWRALAWDGDTLTQPGGLQLDLSAIAKGHAVDRLSELLNELGLPHHLAEIGGELRGAGFKPEGQPWWVDLEPPAADANLQPLRIALHGLAIASSGDYRRVRFDAQGRRLSHTLDPRRGEPIAHGLASVSVVHESAMWADGWSTALMVMGLADGLRFATELGLAARFVQREAQGFSEHFSPALQDLLA
ncbi:MAG: FAD:protein FMN transferase [Roseateles sp.]|nr:MAG: FAD:protein FMN transferase [Roseateles sp.]